MRGYREEILKIIRESGEHLTAEQIFHRVKKRCPQIVLATVYNNVNRLAEQGDIRRISTEGFPDRYDHATRHDHLICKRCGRLSDVTLQDLSEMLERELRQRILSYDLKIQYICPECRERAAAADGIEKEREDIIYGTEQI